MYNTNNIVAIKDVMKKLRLNTYLHRIKLFLSHKRVFKALVSNHGGLHKTAYYFKTNGL